MSWRKRSHNLEETFFHHKFSTSTNIPSKFTRIYIKRHQTFHSTHAQVRFNLLVTPIFLLHQIMPTGFLLPISSGKVTAAIHCIFFDVDITSLNEAIKFSDAELKDGEI